MNTRQTARVAIASVLVALVAGTVVAAIRSRGAPIESAMGALAGTAFFAVSAIVATRAATSSLRQALMHTYLIKILVLAAAGSVIAAFDLDRITFAVALVTAAVVFLAGTLYFNRR